jgi:hypothetical protein
MLLYLLRARDVIARGRRRALTLPHRLNCRPGFVFASPLSCQAHRYWRWQTITLAALHPHGISRTTPPASSSGTTRDRRQPHHFSNNFRGDGCSVDVIGTASYAVLQQNGESHRKHSATSAAGEAISNLAARFAAGSDELAQLVRKDQDLIAEAGRLDKIIIAAVSKPTADRNLAAEDQIRKHIEEIKMEREKLQDVFNQRFPDYVALSKPQPLTVEETQALLADDEAVVIIDLDQRSYVWVITKDRAEWRELSVSADDVSKEVGTLRIGLNPDAPRPFDRKLAYQLYQQVLGPMEGIIAHKTRLSFVLDGALTSLPPQVLITTDPDGKNLNSVDWLVRKYAVAVLPSIDAVLSKTGSPNPIIGLSKSQDSSTRKIYCSCPRR